MEQASTEKAVHLRCGMSDDAELAEADIEEAAEAASEEEIREARVILPLARMRR